MNSVIKFLSVILILSMAAINGEAKTITPSKKTVTKNLSGAVLVSLKGIDVRCPADVDYRQGAKNSIKITGSANIVSELSVTNENDVAIIKFNEGVEVKNLMEGDLIISITSPEIYALRASDGSISVEGALNQPSADLSISATGDGEIETVGITAKSISVDLSGDGSATLDIKNTATNVSIRLAGDAEIECDKINATNVSCAASGDGEAMLRGITATNLAMEAKGDSGIDAQDVATTNLSCSAAGDAEIKLRSGNATRASYSSIGDSEIDAKKLIAETVAAAAGGDGEVSCHATKSLVTSTDGDGMIRYNGNPKITSSGKVKPVKSNF